MHHNIKLIEGVFSKADAKDILLELIANKINYHVRQNFSAMERLGHELEHSTNRIAALKAEEETLRALLDQLDNHQQLQIHGQISLQFVP